MAIKLETLTFHRDGRKLNKKLSVVPESKRHSIHDMILTEDFQPSIKRLLHDEPLQLEASKSTSILSLGETKAYTNVVSFLKTSATSTKNKISTTSGNLIRSKTRSKQQSTRRKKPQTNFLQDIPQTPSNLHDMHFFNLLLATMQHGGYVTPNLYISKDLWYQPNIRFNAIDTKISICETIRNNLQNMNERTDFSDSISIEQDLTVLEITLKNVDRIIKRKLWNPIQETEQLTEQKRGGDQYSVTSSSTRRSAYFEVKTTQTIHQWGNRLSKSVDKMKFETNQSVQNSLYIQLLIDIFTLAKLFDTWGVKLKDKNDIEHLQICYKLFIIIMNKFVIKDYELLLDKWLCQSTSLFLDL